MRLLYQMRNLLELVEGVVGVVQHDPVEDFGEVSVEVEFNAAATVFCFLQLLLYFLEGVQLNAHTFFDFEIYLFNQYFKSFKFLIFS